MFQNVSSFVSLIFDSCLFIQLLQLPFHSPFLVPRTCLYLGVSMCFCYIVVVVVVVFQKQEFGGQLRTSGIKPHRIHTHRIHLQGYNGLTHKRMTRMWILTSFRVCKGYGKRTEWRAGTLSGCVTLGWSLPLSKPQFSYLTIKEQAEEEVLNLWTSNFILITCFREE